MPPPPPSDSKPIFIEVFDKNGNPISKTAVPPPGLATPPSLGLTLAGDDGEGQLEGTADGQYLLLGGYAAAPGVANVAGTTSAATPRVIARIDLFGNIDTSTSLGTAFSGASIRSVASTNGSSFYAAGSAGGLQLATFGGSTATQINAAAPTDLHAVGIFQGQLHASAASGSFQGVGTVGSGLPTTGGQVPTLLPGFPTTAGPSPFDFFFLDAATLYVADSRPVAAGGGIQKWTVVGGTWFLQYTLAVSVSAGCRCVSGFDDAGVPTLFATTAAVGGNDLVRIADLGFGSPFTVLASSGPNAVFCGVHFVPSPTYMFAPDNAAVSQPSSSTLAWRASATGFRSQFIYDTSHFTNQGATGPIVLNRMRFRAANNNTAAGGSYPGNGVTTGVTLDIGTCTTDYLAPSTTFATNRGTMQNVLTFATVNVAAGAGTAPNNFVIDIAIPGGFVYDPTLGQDLLIDVTGPAFLGAMPPMSTGVSLAASRCNRVANVPSTATTGTTSAGFCPVVLFDMFGTGGYPDDGSGNPLVTQATSTVYGAGCDRSRSFGEEFPAGAGTTLDLGSGVSMIPDVAGAPSAYIVVPTTASFVPPLSAPLLSNATTPATIGDDAMSQACSLPFAFPFVGGSATVVHANSNGYLVLGPTGVTGGDFTATFTDMVGTTAGLHAGLPRLFPCWYDFVANRNATVNPAAGLHFDIDPSNTKVYLTWNDVGDIANTTAGAASHTFQVQLSADGTIDVVYGAMSPFASTVRTKIVGFSPGLPSPAPASIDLSVSLPFTSDATEILGLGLSVTAPVLGATMTFTTTNVPAPGIVINWVSPTQFNPGINLGFLGITGCNAYLDPTNAITEALNIGTGTVAFSIAVPTSTGLLGLTAYSQSAALSPTFNAFGAQTSNGVSLVVGNLL